MALMCVFALIQEDSSTGSREFVAVIAMAARGDRFSRGGRGFNGDSEIAGAGGGERGAAFGGAAPDTREFYGAHGEHGLELRARLKAGPDHSHHIRFRFGHRVRRHPARGAGADLPEVVGLNHGE